MHGVRANFVKLTSITIKYNSSILFLNRSYWPDAEATGQLLTELCEDLACEFNVSVIAGQPNRNLSNDLFRKCGTELHHGVEIKRVRHSRFSKASFLGRVLNYITFMISAAFAALFKSRPNIVVVETDPPLLCLLGAVCQWRGSRLVVYLQDLYPDLAVALGKLPNSRWTAWLRRIFFGIYCRADQVVVLSEDMRELLIEGGVPAEKIVIIPNWVDTKLVHPVKENNIFRERHGLAGKFVVMYSGNIGLSQRLEDVLEAAALTQSQPEIVWVLVGGGASKSRFQESAENRQLPNVLFFDYQPKLELAHSLSAADLHLVLLDPRLTRFLMPSKLYGALSAGVPVAVLAAAESELARLVTKESVGVVVEPGCGRRLAECVTRLAHENQPLQEMKARCRTLAVQKFDRAICIGQFATMLHRLLEVPEYRTIKRAG